MNIDNIALVRAISYIPIDGIIRSLEHVPYLTKKSGSNISFLISDLLKDLKLYPERDFSRSAEEGYYNSWIVECSKILMEYLPFESDYNSMVLFALNGLCPDDSENGFGNNTFSNRPVAVIEPLVHHINEVISLVPTDTAIKGDVVLSNEAVILVEESYYNHLSDAEKNLILNCGLNIKLFTGSLKDAVKKELQESGRYTAEDLSLSSSTGGIKPSETSEELKNCINDIATRFNILQMKFFNLITTKDSELPKYSEFCHEFKNILKVNKYFAVRFFKELLVFLGKPDLVEYVEEEFEYKPFLDDIIKWIKEVGIQNYKQFVDEYNYKLIMEQSNRTLPTPAQIVENESNKRKK